MIYRNQTRITLALAVTGIMVAMALVPALLNQDSFAKRTTTTSCEGPQGSSSGSCPGNSGNNGNSNKCETTTTKAGQGQGKGEIKGSENTC
jgi:hypothetical protein